MAEQLDIYNENMQHLGIKDRDAVHRDGDWHRTFHCWLCYRDAQGQDFVIFQKRGPDKEFHANLLDVSAAGHYESGEALADGVREVEEELGIRVDFDDLLPVGIRYSVYRENALVDYEFNEVFLLRDDRPLAAYQPQPNEVSDLVRVNIDAALALFHGDCTAIPAMSRAAGTIDVQQADFVYPLDQYTYRVLILAKRFLDGEKHLVI
ncbi:MAG: NUDIX hydrolase [Anaerolineaceae bacterium]|nr:NUDIX hydrolase [Anaerolineaceae bacterium]